MWLAAESDRDVSEGLRRVKAPQPFSQVSNMDEGSKVICCPACGSFAAKVMSSQAEFEVNCPKKRCHSTMVVVMRTPDDVSVKLVEKKITQRG